MIRLTSSLRETDKHGSGYFGAPRGKKAHRGIDYAAYPGNFVHSCISGEVTKLGYPYGDDLSFKYVQVTDSKGLAYRFFYVEPSVRVGDLITEDDIIGTVQDLTARYEGITPHIHIEIKDGSSYLDPSDYI